MTPVTRCDSLENEPLKHCEPTRIDGKRWADRPTNQGCSCFLLPFDQLHQPVLCSLLVIVQKSDERCTYAQRRLDSRIPGMNNSNSGLQNVLDLRIWMLRES